MTDKEKWIKTAYQLPKQYERVLVTTCDSYVEIGYYSGNNLWTVGEGFDYETDEIIAWQPLPEPYKEESEE